MGPPRGVDATPRQEGGAVSVYYADRGLRVEFATLSRQGGRAWNEDACGCWTSGSGACFVVSDGAGGHGGGDVASETAVKTMLSAFSANPVLHRSAIEALLSETDRAVRYAQGLSETLRRMSATVTALFLDPTARRAQWISLGDTRLYHFRRRSWMRLTRDHSVVQSYVDAGLLCEDHVRGHPERNLLLAALGSGEAACAQAQDLPLAVEDGDAFLICTDGFWEALVESAMTDALIRAGSAQEWLGRMEQLIIDSKLPGQDNYSALSVWVGSPNQITLPWPTVADARG